MNHKDEAQTWLDWSGDQNPEIDGRAMHSVALAQVHATLALVEQQRIANLIAFKAEYDQTPRSEFAANYLAAWTDIMTGLELM